MKYQELLDSPLGKQSPNIQTYCPSLLFPIPRHLNRDELQIPKALPFEGMDIWNAFEISWLNAKGKPEVAIGEFWVPCESERIFESKSFKLYLNSFNQTKFDTWAAVQQLMEKDLAAITGAPIKVVLRHPKEHIHQIIQDFDGTCLDDLDIEVDTYTIDAGLLRIENALAEETVYSHLLKSNCLVTNQPDWASVSIAYQGPKIDHASLLKYIISFRTSNDFHEPLIERMFMDISRKCKPKKLTIYGRYTRRGGIDINAYRSNSQEEIRNFRQPRQ